MFLAMRPHELLDAAINARRLERGLTWSELADRVGVSESALRNIRRGRNDPSALTKVRLEEALGWGAGSVEAISAGRRPILRDRDLPAEHPNSYAAGYQLAQDPDALTAILRSVDSDTLLAELRRRLTAYERDRNQNLT